LDIFIVEGYIVSAEVVEEVWQEKFSQKHRKRYWQNKDTNETSFVKPPSDANTMIESWVEKFSDVSQASCDRRSVCLSG
jgi:hypothetical protein